MNDGHPCQGREFCLNMAYRVVDPYTRALYGQIAFMWFCEDCYDEREMKI